MPKTYGRLYPSITAFANLHHAYRKAARGKRGQVPVAQFELDLEGNLLALQDELRSHVYRPGGYRSFYIRDPKHRLISAAPFRDRVVHNALCNIMKSQRSPFLVASADGAAAGRIAKRPRVPPASGAARGLSPWGRD